MLNRKEMSMKIPPLDVFGKFGMRCKGVVKNKSTISNILPPYNPDTVSFSSSIAYYLKKYNTLPEEIKKVLSPKDAIDMFKDMEMIQKGTIKRTKIGQGKDSSVFENPWLKDYYSLIVENPQKIKQVIYSRYGIGDAIWSDNDNYLIQIVKKVS